MRAAILQRPGADPEPGIFDDPVATGSHQVIEVAVAGVNPVDLALASGRMGEPPVPSVVGKEGVGTVDGGLRVYFDAPVAPYGSWAERTLIEAGTGFPIPDGLNDDQAVTMGIAGLAAWLSLEHHARVQPGERVLVLGATGVVGQIAVQAARVMGAGHIVAAGRNREALERARERGADELAQLGGDDDTAELRRASGSDQGYDVVIDPLYGAPFEAALPATAPGARLVTIGQTAGAEARVPFRALQGRTHIGHITTGLPRPVVREAYDRLTSHAASGRITVETQRFGIDQAVEAWHAQQHSPHHKLVVAP